MSVSAGTIARMSPSSGSLHIEGWSPEYGNPTDVGDGFDDQMERVDDTVEVAGAWLPIAGADDGVDEVVFVDGVRRIDARLTIDDADGPTPGICGSFGVGAVTWDRRIPRSEVTHTEIRRLGVFTRGRGVAIPPAGPQLVYFTESVPEADPGMLVQHFHGEMRKAEARMSEKLAQEGLFVIADGPINDLSATEKVGFIKTHRVPYLEPARMAIIGRLDTGQRTPMFAIGRYRRYSWYTRIGDVQGGHSWSGVVRCEVSGALTFDHARHIADRTTAILPKVASEGHIDPRAPQNLVPIAALERQLRRLLGDPGFVYRRLRSAVMGHAA